METWPHLKPVIDLAVAPGAIQDKHRSNRGETITGLGQAEKNIDYTQQALAISREIGDWRGVGGGGEARRGKAMMGAWRRPITVMKLPLLTAITSGQFPAALRLTAVEVVQAQVPRPAAKDSQRQRWQSGR